MKIELTQWVVCPKCHHVLTMNSNRTGLICQHEQLEYPIIDGIPQLLEEFSTKLPSPSSIER